MRRTTITALGMWLLGMLCGAVIADDNSDKARSSWPQWRGLLQNNKSAEVGVFDFDNGDGLKVAWKTTIGEGYSSVSIADNRAVTMYAREGNDVLVAFDATTGKELWQYTINGVYVGKGGSEDGPSSTPLLDGDYVFALGRKGKLFALDAQTGKEIWSRNVIQMDDAQEPFHGFTTSPVVHNDILILETGGKKANAISGFDKKTGKLLWSNGEDEVQYHSPLLASIGGMTQVVASGSQYLFGVDPQNGKKLWEYHHKGRGGSVNPVQVDEQHMLVPISWNEARMIKVVKGSEGFTVEELWKTRHIKRSWNVPVYHEGHFYGYSGRFLTCVDAETGETVWKSRPPGDGFTILVDNHLVVLTKKGTLHVAPASPSGYEEKANIQLFERAAWAPPSFANGRIYARSYSEIASIEISKVDNAITIAKVEKKTVGLGSEFNKFVSKVKRASNKKMLIDDFMKKHRASPIIEGDNLAHFIYRGEVKDLVISGDMFETGADETMNRIEGTDFYYFSLELEADAHLGYQLTRNFEERITDPLNERKVTSFNGEESEFAMPKWRKPKHLKEADAAKKGSLKEHTFKSDILGNERTVQVYLPKGYAGSDRKYPTVYVNYGRMAVDFGLMPNSLDNLIAKGKIEPLIAVFVHRTSDRRAAFQEYARDAKANYAKMMAEELVPFIDSNYRTNANAASRAVMGGDEGGYSAFYTTFKHPGVFGKVAGQSSHLHSAEGDELRAMVRSSNKLPVSFYMDWGKYDYRNSGSEYHWGDNNREFAKILKEKGYSVSGGQVNEGFGWTSWRTRTDRILTGFFPARNM